MMDKFIGAMNMITIIFNIILQYRSIFKHKRRRRWDISGKILVLFLNEIELL